MVEGVTDDAERKQVTVLFADVKGSMDLAEQHDPEEWRKIMQRFFAILTDAVERIIAATKMPLQLGGGMRNIATIESWLDKGVARVIIGTAAVREPALVSEAARLYPGRLAVALDARDGVVAVAGWAQASACCWFESSHRRRLRDRPSLQRRQSDHRSVKGPSCCRRASSTSTHRRRSRHPGGKGRSGTGHRRIDQRGVRHRNHSGHAARRRVEHLGATLRRRRRNGAPADEMPDAAGFEGFELLQPDDDRGVFFVLTRWRSNADFVAWTKSPDFAARHARHYKPSTAFAMMFFWISFEPP